MPSDASERWLAISQQFRIGPKRRDGLMRRARPDDQVTAGQLRQASWTAAAAALLVIDVDDSAARVRAFPATLDPDVESASAVVIEEEVSPLHGPIIVWPAEVGWISFSALDSTIATVSASVLQTVCGGAALSISGGVRRGRQDPPSASGAALAIDELFDDFDVLKEAPRFEVPDSSSPRVPLRVPLAIIMDSLQVPQPRAMAILAGREPLAPAEAARLAEAAGLPIGDVMASVSALPSDLMRELHEPRWRTEIRRRAIDGDESQARTLLGYRAYQLAARESGSGRDLWRQRIQAVLAAEGD